MQTNEWKCVMVIDKELPVGVIANTAGILGITLGRELPEQVGVDVADASGTLHRGIVETPVPILQGTPDSIRDLRERLYSPDFEDVLAVDFSDAAQSCRTYDEWIRKAAGIPEGDLRYLGLAICGAKKKVNRLTGNLPLLR